MSNNAIVLCGLPGSGKSTWARFYALSHKAVIINKDAIRTMFKGQYFFDKDYEELVGACARDTALEALKQGFDIILDETNITMERRRNWALIFKPIANVYLLWFSEIDSNLKYRCIDQRGMSRDAWHSVIENMKVDFEAPVASETYFDGIMKVGGPDLENVEFIIDNVNMGNLQEAL